MHYAGIWDKIIGRWQMVYQMLIVKCEYSDISGTKKIHQNIKKSIFIF